MVGQVFQVLESLYISTGRGNTFFPVFFPLGVRTFSHCLDLPVALCPCGSMFVLYLEQSLEQFP